jgi:hypothetical protein
MVQGDDGREFRDMRVVHGELPPLRYPGQYKEPGAQYMRGLAEWADDGSFADKQAMWLVYSVNKEDIWIARVPLPVRPNGTGLPADDFAQVKPGAAVPGWNIYSPRWAPVAVVEENGNRFLELRDGDPFDYARAVRVFPASARVRAELCVAAAQMDARLDIEMGDAAGRRPVRVSLTDSGRIQADDGGKAVDVGKYEVGTFMTIVLTADLEAGHLNIQVNAGEAKTLAVAEQAVGSVERFSLRTGSWRVPGAIITVDAHPDAPLTPPSVFRVRYLTMRPLP